MNRLIQPGYRLGIIVMTGRHARHPVAKWQGVIERVVLAAFPGRRVNIAPSGEIEQVA
ncbi:hypothetical protein MEG1DRAFT_01677 [Photorhabdus temperata subsp. temperata Meg1]|uniref:Uncharacterized protein n=1 Tax=Photorhabdus temperata subsp. temperata Meg1 TaxID=1393735 RepID=A0A081RY22_PHOTE|nr:hypothetical protein MEG1DRAFT_01677 [Photorhabdus temperata subsp. temperata Meg1]